MYLLNFYCCLCTSFVLFRSQCSPVLTPQMTEGAIPFGFVTEKVSVRHCDAVVDPTPGAPWMGFPFKVLKEEEVAVEGPVITNVFRSRRSWKRKKYFYGSMVTSFFCVMMQVFVVAVVFASAAAVIVVVVGGRGEKILFPVLIFSEQTYGLLSTATPILFSKNITSFCKPIHSSSECVISVSPGKCCYCRGRWLPRTLPPPSQETQSRCSSRWWSSRNGW